MGCKIKTRKIKTYFRDLATYKGGGGGLKFSNNERNMPTSIRKYLFSYDITSTFCPKKNYTF